jgi:HrpA-like RNA helicase
MIGVTQPRMVAAVSTATRVADELDTRLGSIVGYQVSRVHHTCITCAATNHEFTRSCTALAVSYCLL